MDKKLRIYGKTGMDSKNIYGIANRTIIIVAVILFVGLHIRLNQLAGRISHLEINTEHPAARMLPVRQHPFHPKIMNQTQQHLQPAAQPELRFTDAG